MLIEVHVKTRCPFCVMATQWLTEREIPFILHVHDDDEDRSRLYDRLGLEEAQRTVPQIIVDGTRLGGYSALIESQLHERCRSDLATRFKVSSDLSAQGRIRQRDQE